jgi:hypothetical protein
MLNGEQRPGDLHLDHWHSTFTIREAWRDA